MMCLFLWGLKTAGGSSQHHLVALIHASSAKHREECFHKTCSLWLQMRKNPLQQNIRVLVTQNFGPGQGIKRAGGEGVVLNPPSLRRKKTLRKSQKNFERLQKRPQTRVSGDFFDKLTKKI